MTVGGGMIWVRLAVVALGLVEGAWMTFDGTRALTVGDYVTPSSGAHAGQLGPWNYAVRAVGIAPRSTAMKLIFVVYGVSWLIISLGLGLQSTWASQAMLIAAIATLWYLPVGTLFGIIQLVGLIYLRRTGRRMLQLN
ncbi:MAG TPA: hypothetical protein VF836_13900 [Gemmatimonadaceae bacterium]